MPVRIVVVHDEHRMASIAEQRGAPSRPARQRIALEQRPDETCLGGGNDPAHLHVRLSLRIVPSGNAARVGGADGEVAGAEVLRDLGESWDIVTDMAIKLVPGGHPYHALAEAAATAAREGNIAADRREAADGRHQPSGQ